VEKKRGGERALFTLDTEKEEKVILVSSYEGESSKTETERGE